MTKHLFMSAAHCVDAHRILIADDDIDWLMLLERQLVKEGYVVETAASLAEAEELCVYFEPHLVLLDININGLDGRQLCWQLKHSPDTAGVKVLLMSGYDCSLSRAALFGADGVIAKPVPLAFLLQLLHVHLPPQYAPHTSSGIPPSDTRQ
jgi:DNA-binding response OmpR family regulator